MEIFDSKEYTNMEETNMEEMKKAAKKEEQIIMRFIKKHPFPSYNDIRIKLMVAQEIEMIAEFGEYNYNCLKVCYDNLMEEEICKKMGEAIYKRGGMQAMQQNFYTLLYYGPTAQSKNNLIKYAPKVLSHTWHGIGEWLH